MKLTYILFFIAALNSLTAQNRYYVNTLASGLDNGQTWGDAFTDLQAAFQTAIAGDEIWVAEGTYHPTGTLDRAIYFAPASGVKVFGGFSGSETTLVQRDWVAHPSVLSGDIGVPGDSTDNSYNIMYLHEPDSNTVIDGFMFRDGVANNSGVNSFGLQASGGGLYIMGYDADAYPDIVNCAFVHNTALAYGGGVMVYGGGDGSVAPRFINCRFESNHAMIGTGGGLARIGASWIERGDDLRDCQFLRNLAGYQGGGCYFRDRERSDQLDIRGCRFEENAAADDGGGMYITIGRSVPSGLSIVGTTFERNVADDGAAFKVIQNGFLFAKNLLIDSCTIRNNIYQNHNNFSQKSATNIQLFGAGAAKGNIKNSLLEKNKDWRHIGYWECPDLDFVCSNLSIVENQAIGALLSINTKPKLVIQSSIISENSIRGEITFHSGGNISYLNCKFNKNMSNIPSKYISVNLHVLNLTNCIFSNNNILLGATNSKAIKIATNCVFENISNKKFFLQTENHGEYNYCYFDTLDCQSLGSRITCGPGNLVGVNPLFRDTANGDYSLLPCSPLINAGSNAAAAGILTDITGAPRIQEGTVDIGAFEAPAFALATTPQILPACTGTQGGAITITPTNGCEPYTYQWLPPVGNGPEVNQLPTGDYAYTVTDGSGRMIADTVNVPQAPSPVLAPTAQDVQCGSILGGSATANATSGTAPYTYLWGNGATTNQITMLPPGQYPVTVTDFSGCQDSAQVSISRQGQITLMVDGEAISCFGASDAMVSAAPANGKAPFSYLWSQGATDSLLTGIGSGAYTVTATDFYGCTATFTFTLGEPALLQATATATTTNSLSNPNGTASLASVSGGTQAYQYLWSNGGQTQTISGLAMGVYTVTVTDAHGCTATATAEVKFVSSTGDLGDVTVRVWPNPMRDRLEVEALGLGSGAYWFVVRDGLGRQLAAGENISGRAVLDVSGLPAGVYTWELGDGTVLRGIGKVVK